jgi:hypothetical protein
VWEGLQKQFPKADIVASTFDNFTRAVMDAGDAVVSKLPVMTQEMGDTWVYGVPSDPQKVARMRLVNRVWRAAVQELGGGDIRAGARKLMDDPVLKNATRFALKLGEHTWGRDVKSYLKDNYDWTNADFAKAKAPGMCVCVCVYFMYVRMYLCHISYIYTYILLYIYSALHAARRVEECVSVRYFRGVVVGAAAVGHHSRHQHSRFRHRH